VTLGKGEEVLVVGVNTLGDGIVGIEHEDVLLREVFGQELNAGARPAGVELGVRVARFVVVEVGAALVGEVLEKELLTQALKRSR
jgi:hypothetical protein